ncbi:asparagine synthase-related protein [Bradyrhizobium sp. CB1015]|uniref:asparagine synthase-related protein n=1 Tax=Bradyrhizobium sp. CB1015 TaxID=2976822 RepID=UPI0021AAF275|nr:asparagine synthase-related protein [Bradyrhizobium sp. CB1015]UWU90640.1 asparagine synthase-related protein [Bradyrhizobium sp. CB1015]
MRGALRPLCTDLFVRSREIFEPYLEPNAVRDLWQEHAERKSNHAYALWPLLTFGIWRSQLSGKPIGGER